MSLLGFLEHFSLGKADISQLEESVNKHTESVSRNIKIVFPQSNQFVFGNNFHFYSYRDL